MKLLILVSLFISAQISFAQDLKVAGLAYFLDAHYSFDKELIAKEQIKQIEKIEYRYDFDTVYLETVIEKYEFDSLGNPTYNYYKPISYDKRETYFTYDSLNQLVKKEIHGISPELRYKMIESYEWTYDRGFLIRQRRFLMQNTMPLKSGSSGFPERLFLFSNDSIAYVDTAIVILTNDINNCLDVASMIYPPSFKSVVNTILKFHSNNKLASKMGKSEGIVQKHTYNECGTLINVAPSEKCQNFFPIQVACFDPTEMNICNSIDTTRLEGELVYFTRNESSIFQHDSGPGTQISSISYTYYNNDFNVIHAKDTTTYERGAWHMQNSFGDFGVTKNIRITDYEYYDNGLLHKTTTRDEDGKILKVLAHKLGY